MFYLCARLHVSVIIDHHQALFCESSLKVLVNYWDPTMFTVSTSVYICHINNLKSENKMVIGK